MCKVREASTLVLDPGDSGKKEGTGEKGTAPPPRFSLLALWAQKGGGVWGKLRGAIRVQTFLLLGTWGSERQLSPAASLLLGHSPLNNCSLYSP